MRSLLIALLSVGLVRGFVLPDSQIPYFQHLLQGHGDRTQADEHTTTITTTKTTTTTATTTQTVTRTQTITPTPTPTPTSEGRIAEAFENALNMKVGIGSDYGSAGVNRDMKAEMEQNSDFFPSNAWLGKNVDDHGLAFEEGADIGGRHHHTPTYHGPPAHRQPHGDHGHDGLSPHVPPEKIPLPYRDGHFYKDDTIWDLVSRCNQTTTFHRLAKNDTEFMNLLKDPNQNVTLFVPTDHAFKKLLPNGIPKEGLSEEYLRKMLNYHTAEGTHDSRDLMERNTLLSRLQEDQLGKGMHQRLRLGLDRVHGPSVNFFADILIVDFYVKNGVIHGISKVLLPPPRISTITDLVPTEFSTTAAALYKTGLIQYLLPPDDDKHSDYDSTRRTYHPHPPGLTVFAPSNRDWEKLGFKTIAFLFSSYGHKYLDAIMKYHIVPGVSMYSDAFEQPPRESEAGRKHKGHKKHPHWEDPALIPQGYHHFDLPTLLKPRGGESRQAKKEDVERLHVDLTRVERRLSFRVNGYGKVIISDGIAGDGALHVPEKVLLPPKDIKRRMEEEKEEEEEGEVSVEELKKRLERFVDVEEGEEGQEGLQDEL